MGFIDALFGNKKIEKEEEVSEKKKKGGLISAGLGLGKYEKTEEQKIEAKESRSLPSRLGELKIKKYNRPMSFRYNKNKKELKLGMIFL